jgi:hypothetical protein
MSSRFWGGLVWVLAAALVLWAYYPGTSGPAMLDDRSSLDALESLGDKFGLNQAVDVVSGERSGPLGRPVSMASFVLQARWVGVEITASKLVNVGLHLLNGLLLLLLVLRLLRSANYHNVTLFAVATSILWMAAPLFVSTVLYAVQRMAILACSFMMIALYLYLVARERYLAGRGVIACVVTLALSIMLGAFTKENTVVILALIPLLELLWFSPGDSDREKLLRRLAAGALLGGMVVSLCLAPIFFPWLELAYQLREFTLFQRLLTQAVVLWEYLGQLVRPDVSVMGLIHDDYPLVSSLTAGSVASHALVAWLLTAVAACGACFSALGRRLVFCLSVYLIGHAVESTFLPLELYFEHRNYFPAIGVFLAPAVILAAFCHRYPQATAALFTLLLLPFVSSLLLLSSQSVVWASSPLLRIQQVLGHPNSFRAQVEYASQLAGVGAIELAYEHSALAHAVTVHEGVGDHLLRDATLACSASAQFNPAAERLAAVSESARPVRTSVAMVAYLRKVQSGACPQLQAREFATMFERQYLIERTASASKGVYVSLAVLDSALERYASALQYLDRVEELEPLSIREELMKLHFLVALGRGEQVTELLRSLEARRDRGELSWEQETTLQLYLES